MTKLENCPFCDGIAIFKCKSKIEKTDGIGFSFSIGCTRCGTAPMKLDDEEEGETDG